ncbi:TPA: EAL domain-containing protein [Klebsiella pneumoniae]|nr:EAL domain-containing protein [Klebsiella pneumoniae]HDH0295240.1 EAL domain-containing protein [Klebsiella pneumoniae]
MQTAQKVITAYRHKRIIVCLLVALATLGATLAIRFISQRSVNEDYIRAAASQRVAALNDILRPLSAQRATLLPLVGKPCPDIHLTLRKMAASLQTIRSVALVTSGIVYCSSIFGPRQADLHRLQPALPAPRPLLLFSNDSSLLKGSPVLIQWYPAAENGLDGVMLVVNIELLGTLILNEKSALISDVSLQVGDRYFSSRHGLLEKAHVPQGTVIYRQRSTEFPFTVNINGPGASAIALEELPGELPLALIFSLLMTGIAWLATAGRMSFSREISLGISAREFALWCQPLQDGDQHMAEHLHFKGVQLAIDDFGTGNTSLSWLEKLRPDVLKIDRSFTSSVGIDSVNATVTDIIIALANRLHIVTVAEGVETLEQESYLRSHGVDVLQGFYYARPMPVEAFPAWLASREESEDESETTE